MSTDPEAFFGADSEDEKQEAFEESTLKLVLGQLGWDSGKIRGEKSELGPNFGWGWFNGEDLIKPDVRSGRCLRFTFFDLLTKPRNHEITKLWQDNLAEYRSDEGNIFIFKVFQHGRWVATDLDLSGGICLTPFLHVDDGVGTSFNVTPFTNFFKSRWNA